MSDNTVPDPAGPSEEPLLSVGILEAPRFHATFSGPFVLEGHGKEVGGPVRVRTEGDGLALETEAGFVINAKDVTLVPRDASNSSFLLNNVVIGKQFHWQRDEDQRFRGGVRLLRLAGGSIAAINRIHLEEYLASVVSSEMSGEGAVEFLKAHAIASRSWLLAQLGHARRGTNMGGTGTPDRVADASRMIRWYDREDHELYDVCADDHCQRYQGITRPITPAVGQAVHETRGKVLMSGGAVCDARFSKSCGGVTERFDHVWDSGVHPAWSVPVVDAGGGSLPDLTREDQAAAWIGSSPAVFCNVKDERVLGRILGKTDRATADFFRWKVTIPQEELAERLKRKSGIDFGAIRALVPAKRGTSGRIEELTIVGTERTMTVGKELEIRRLLSDTHLFSSAFVVTVDDGGAAIPSRFTLTGAGWGHGVGLCQIGAGVMGERGFRADQILAHYFVGATIETLYA